MNERRAFACAVPHPTNLFADSRLALNPCSLVSPGWGVTRRVPCPGHKGVPCSHMFDYSNLLGAIERPQPILEIQCPISFEPVSVAGLLFGIHWLMREPVLESIAGAKAELAKDIGATLSALADLSAGIDTQTTLLQREFLKQYHRDQRMVETRCPNVFTVGPVSGGSVWRRIVGERVALQLYCQAPGVWHPTVDGGRYELTLERAWLRAMAPYLIGLTKVLKLAVPLAAPVLGMVDQATTDLYRNQIDVTAKLVAALPGELGINLEDADLMSSPDSHVRSIEGSSLRSLRSLLESVDSQQEWGHLVPLLTPEGHLLWLCANTWSPTKCENCWSQERP